MKHNALKLASATARVRLIIIQYRVFE